MLREYQIDAESAVARTGEPGTRAPMLGSLEFDADTLRANYNRKAFPFRHRLAGHPRLAIPELIKLARRLPADCLHQHRAEVTMGDDFYNAAASHPSNCAIEETIERIEVANSYVMLRNPHVDPEFGAFLAPLWEEIGRLVDPFDPGRTDHMSFVFIASPGAVTPFHLDRVSNFHLQIQGEKTIYLWDPYDRESVTEEDLAHCVAEPRTFHAPFRPELMARAVPFLQRPGLGVHHPWGAPHAVECGSEVSVSLSINFRSDEMKRRIALHELNHRLRRLGLTPVGVGQSPWRDALKFLALRGYRSVKEKLRGKTAEE